jgi:hypothetical protein
MSKRLKKLEYGNPIKRFNTNNQKLSNYLIIRIIKNKG